MKCKTEEFPTNLQALEKIFHYEPYPGFWKSVHAKIDLTKGMGEA